MKQIPKSFIDANPNFTVDIAAYAKEMRDWNAHMQRVAADAASGLPKEKAHHPFPAPVAPDAITACVDPTTGQAAYQVIDDSASVANQKRAALIQQVSQIEDAETAKILPVGKRRLHNMQMNDIIKNDGNIQQKLKIDIDTVNSSFATLNAAKNKIISDAAVPPPTLLDKAKALVGAAPPPPPVADTSAVDQQIATVVQQASALHDRLNNIAGERSAQDASFMKNYDTTVTAIAAVQRWAAELHSTIEDLDSIGVGKFVIPPYVAPSS